MHTVGNEIKSKICSAAYNTYLSTSILCWPLQFTAFYSCYMILLKILQHGTETDINFDNVDILFGSILQFVIICLFHS